MLKFKRSTRRISNNSVNYLLTIVPDLIASVEDIIGAGNGSEKKRIVLDLIDKFIESNDLDIKFDFSNYIESILSTPSKKNV